MNGLVKFLLCLLPLALFSRLFGIFSRHHFSSKLQNYINKYYANYFNINLKEASQPLADYKSLNEFFTRHLKDGIRPLRGKARQVNAIISPVDGMLNAADKLAEKTLLKVKGRQYVMAELLKSPQYSQYFLGGSYFIYYLSPSDCHRIYAPCDAKIIGYNYIPGRLFPVNEWAVSHIPHLFTRNERIIVWLKHKDKHFALIAVGATNVGSINLTYISHTPKLLTNAWHRKAHSHIYERAINIQRGAEIGYFSMGSTVIILHSPNSITFPKKHSIPMKVQYGQHICNFS